MMMFDNDRARLAALFSLALLVRCAAVAAATTMAPPPFAWEAAALPRSLVERGFLGWNWFGLTEPRPSAFLPPVYPLVVAAAMWVAGGHYMLLLQLWQALLSAIAAVLVVPLAREISD